MQAPGAVLHAALWTLEQFFDAMRGMRLLYSITFEFVIFSIYSTSMLELWNAGDGSLDAAWRFSQVVFFLNYTACSACPQCGSYVHNVFMYSDFTYKQDRASLTGPLVPKHIEK